MAGQPGRSGGPRQGSPGVKYPNRSDMRKGPHQAAKAAPNQTYGVAGQQLAAQHAMPLANAPGVPQAAPGGSPSPSAAPGGMGGGGPQVIPSLTAPTARPNEPVTTGLPSGPGAGPEALNPQINPLVKAAAVLNNMGGKVDPAMAMIRHRINAELGNQGAA